MANEPADAQSRLDRATAQVRRPGTLVLLNKPYGVLCQFTGEGRPTLADWMPLPGIYPAGRLDADSEGLVLLTGDGALQARIADPRHALVKTYRVQVEGIATSAQVEELSRGVYLRDGPARAAHVRALDEPPGLWPRDPPIRRRLHIPTSWLEIGLAEGRNRQVRRMTAAVGLPTLRLVRWSVGPWTVEGLAPGAWRVEGHAARVLSSAPSAAPARAPARRAPDPGAPPFPRRAPR